MDISENDPSFWPGARRAPFQRRRKVAEKFCLIKDIFLDTMMKTIS
jgi:hypothetical protein